VLDVGSLIERLKVRTMEDVFVVLSGTIDLDEVEAIVDSVCAGVGLYTSMKSTLKQYPGCIHWHFKNGKAAGVLEVTWWPRQQENKDPLLWLSIHGNRLADWIGPLLPKLKGLHEAA